MKDGGPAFPHGDEFGCHGPGMSLRDWFAGQALAGLLAKGPNKVLTDRLNEAEEGEAVKILIATAAVIAFRQADAMLAERSKDRQP